MLQIFTDLANWLTYGLPGLQAGTRHASAVHFFVEEFSKIFALLVVMIYVIARPRAPLNGH